MQTERLAGLIGGFPTQKEKGRARKRPGQSMKVITFRGEHRPAQWEENTERCPLFGA